MTIALDPADRAIVARAVARLGLEVPAAVEKLTAGDSGSLVVRLVLGDRRRVLKVTRDPARLERARRELRLVSESPAGLARFLPAFVAGDAAADEVCLVTTEHLPLPRPVTDGHWTAIAAALGGLHRVPPPAWWDGPEPVPPSPGAVATATRTWAALTSPRVAERAAELVGPGGRPPTPPVATTSLVHGDCHLDNIVLDARGDLRWIDWQEARNGDPFADLAFLWQRAEFSGAQPPRASMTAAHAEARGLPSGAELEHGLDLADLRLLFLSWPPFLSYGSAAARRRMADRVEILVERLASR